uniref:U6-theraphotoxin-Hhn1a 1 n=1 Tax=Cyriopagopus hainanus TaxID=2781057 RepID=H12A1_CYRHA|nr:RecName: Full=U6-theraphotoxin-Hhn1a 1; Short=U6-TRTX-Hhn1a; AltName: Full=Hainantoxin-XII; Short=HNTX-XII; Flags: Precursor [Haplopelma hainanum]ADB56814.1 HNTX-XII precursor [Haplopelma hainanum]
MLIKQFSRRSKNMKVQILLAFAALFVLAVGSYASESKKLDLRDALFSAMFSADYQLNPQERGCRYFLGECKKTSECCEHLACHDKHKWCAWDWTIGK